MGLTWNGTGLLLQGTTADTLAVPIVPVGVAGIRGDRTVLSQRGEVQVHRPLVVTLKILKSWVVKGMVKEGSSRLGWAAQLVSVARICQGCRFDPPSGHIRESTNECINKLEKQIDICLSFSLLSLSLSKINK